MYLCSLNVCQCELVHVPISSYSLGTLVQKCMHNNSLSLCLSLAAQWRSADCHRGNKQQQLSRTGLIKQSAIALYLTGCCSLDRSRPERSRQRLFVAMITGCHSKWMPGRKRRTSRKAYTVVHSCSVQQLWTALSQHFNEVVLRKWT